LCRAAVWMADQPPVCPEREQKLMDKVPGFLLDPAPPVDVKPDAKKKIQATVTQAIVVLARARGELNVAIHEELKLAAFGPPGEAQRFHDLKGMAARGKLRDAAKTFQSKMERLVAVIETGTVLNAN